MTDNFIPSNYNNNMYKNEMINQYNEFSHQDYQNNHYQRDQQFENTYNENMNYKFENQKQHQEQPLSSEQFDAGEMLKRYKNQLGQKKNRFY